MTPRAYGAADGEGLPAGSSPDYGNVIVLAPGNDYLLILTGLTIVYECQRGGIGGLRAA
ncbi:MAG: hypothetical protein ACK5M4_01395 [Pseudorhodobacter sp.]